MPREKVSEKERARILKLFREKKVKWAGDISTFGRKKDGKVRIRGVSFWGPWKRKDGRKVVGNNGGMKIQWEANGIGFGEMDVVLSRDGKLLIYTEAMSDEFVKKVLEEARILAKRMD